MMCIEYVFRLNDASYIHALGEVAFGTFPEITLIIS